LALTFEVDEGLVAKIAAGASGRITVEISVAAITS